MRALKGLSRCSRGRNLYEISSWWNPLSTHCQSLYQSSFWWHHWIGLNVSENRADQSIEIVMECLRWIRNYLYPKFKSRNQIGCWYHKIQPIRSLNLVAGQSYIDGRCTTIRNQKRRQSSNSWLRQRLKWCHKLLRNSWMTSCSLHNNAFIF